MAEQPRYVVRFMMDYDHYRIKGIYGNPEPGGDIVVYDSYQEAQEVAEAITDDIELMKPVYMESMLDHFTRMVVSRHHSLKRINLDELIAVRQKVNLTAHVVYVDDAQLSYHREMHENHALMLQRQHNEMLRDLDTNNQLYTWGIAMVFLVLMLIILSSYI